MFLEAEEAAAGNEEAGNDDDDTKDDDTKDDDANVGADGGGEAYACRLPFIFTPRVFDDGWFTKK
jgi:hypothetical protein